VPFSFTASTPANPLSIEQAGKVAWPSFVVDYSGVLVMYGASFTTRATLTSYSDTFLIGGRGPFNLYLTATQRGGAPSVCSSSLLPTGAVVLGADFTMPDSAVGSVSSITIPVT
jgi:hypothetical protein